MCGASGVCKLLPPWRPGGVTEGLVQGFVLFAAPYPHLEIMGSFHKQSFNANQGFVWKRFDRVQLVGQFRGFRAHSFLTVLRCSPVFKNLLYDFVPFLLLLSL